MNNLDYIRENINIEVIIDYISLNYCNNGDCNNCPVSSECNDIYDLLELRLGKENVTIDKVISMPTLFDFIEAQNEERN